MARDPLWWRYRHFWRRSVPRDVDDELRFHFESRVEDLAARGMTPDEARAQAAAEFGDVADVRARLEAIDRAAELRRGRAAWWEGIALDARYALRGLRRSPGLALDDRGDAGFRHGGRRRDVRCHGAAAAASHRREWLTRRGS